jgi:glucose-6-phosphate-specific signal transduction histidine kinase
LFLSEPGRPAPPEAIVVIQDDSTTTLPRFRGRIPDRLRPLLSTRERQFWTLQVVGWVGYFLAAYLGALAYEKPTSYYTVLVVAAVAGFILTALLRLFYRPLWHRPPMTIVVSILGASYLLALAWTLIRNQVYWNIHRPEYEPDGVMAYFSGVTGGLYVFLCWSGLYFGVKYWQILQKERERSLRAQALAHEAQLKMLRYQLNPHFLFNTLNAISTLILDNDTRSASRAVGRLSEFLRYTLHNDPMQMVTLEQELKSLNLYLDIEKVRFQDRLEVVVDVDRHALIAKVPSLITQPIIENAIKYAIAPRKEGGRLTIAAHVVAGRLIIELSDNGPGLGVVVAGQRARGEGVGLANTRERLKQIYDGDFILELGSAQPSGLKVMIGLPWET